MPDREATPLILRDWYADSLFYRGCREVAAIRQKFSANDVNISFGRVTTARQKRKERLTAGPSLHGVFCRFSIGDCGCRDRGEFAPRGLARSRSAANIASGVKQPEATGLRSIEATTFYGRGQRF